MKPTDGYIQESGGLKLLKKGRKGLFRLLFSRMGMIILLLLLQLGLLVVMQLYFLDFMPHYYLIAGVFCTGMVLYLINSGIDPTSKLTWLVVIMLMPAFGALLLLYTRSDIGHRLLRDRFIWLSCSTREQLSQDEEVLADFEREKPEAAGLARYLRRTGCHPVYKGTKLTYFPLGDDMFPVLLEQLERAEKYIFLEFFIVDEGLMWGRVLEILARKAAEGVEVRMMYDGTCEIALLPHDYPRRLKELGIKCKIFAPLTPFVSTHYNYRDHRKILVIDGRVAFTGGVNLADEYINRRERFGHWKDTALMLEGRAAESFQLMFQQMWNVGEKQPEFSVPEAAPAEEKLVKGYVIPYGDCPLDDERVGEWVYMDLLNRAQNYVHIMTPYLILDGEMETALRFAAERGVDVRLILPGIPDKKLPYALAKTHYDKLLRSGVKIYEYTPGFVHAKVFVCDGKEAVVGTINLDYRSLYHHFECAAYISGAACLEDIERDFLKTQEQCRSVTRQSARGEKWTVKLAGVIMKVIAPLL